ncbi:type II secretion system F family protein [Ornithinicoccus halotolerans]|uniref:type II secretion system F family protein n=1 Tax=Ornithinicoccus halotolerans TaxID=1748220 RepID=UPI001296524D|nr:type II secretion system F family protein [Ornithinicoccus halotolerans]
MTGSFLGLLLGVGLALVWWSLWPAPEPRSGAPGAVGRYRDRWRDDVLLAGLGGLGLSTLAALSVLVAAVVAVLAAAVTGVPAIAVAFGLMGAAAVPVTVRARARRRRAELREVWPEAIDHVASAVRAGLALPEALVQLSDRGPGPLREPFAAFALDYRATGRFVDALDGLKDRMADPVADRLVEALRIAREVGGTDLGRLLRTLSEFLRADGRARAELAARQSWTVNAARLALAAPWLVLLMLATRGTALEAYREPGGVVVLVVGAVASLLAYRLMLRIGRLPEEQRVLR